MFAPTSSGPSSLSGGFTVTSGKTRSVQNIQGTITPAAHTACETGTGTISVAGKFRLSYFAYNTWLLARLPKDRRTLRVTENGKRVKGTFISFSLNAPRGGANRHYESGGGIDINGGTCDLFFGAKTR
jgi:hypothetical protein